MLSDVIYDHIVFGNSMVTSSITSKVYNVVHIGLEPLIRNEMASKVGVLPVSIMMILMTLTKDSVSVSMGTCDILGLEETKFIVRTGVRWLC